ncbi:heme biosynthesis HemY N-terminal domain-containing protein [Kerstersia gyiorum]|uniref:heme biosynthesis HemY N-terminal domain-containing protein n=1 Tax=Kerstersia gyiorum TaxID=206506 RepID=UPI0014306773|nr:heme biosynthesis HemY N-terminal domain-containing protein [Kerstersia gyiorum]
MATWFKSLLLLALAVTVAVLLRRYEGDVLILLPDWRVQLPLARAVAVVLLTFVLLYIVLRLLSWALAIPERVRGWRQRRVQKRDMELLEQGWITLLEGRYAQAEKSLTALLDQAKPQRRKVLAALSAARAADELGEFSRRDSLLASAAEQAAGDESLSQAVMLVGADMLLDQGKPAEALERLAPLQENASRHLHAQRLFLRAHHALGHHDQSFALARALSRRGVLGVAEANAILGAAAAARLRGSQGDDWRKVWKDLKSEERLVPEVALAGAYCFDAAGQADEAGKILETAINDSFDPRLIEAYAQCDADQVPRRLEKAEKWLQRNADQPELLRALGALCLQGQLWGPAERYLVRSVQLKNDPRTHVLLGSLYDRLGKREESLRHWRLASKAHLGRLPELQQKSFLPPADTQADPKIRDADDSFGSLARYPAAAAAAPVAVMLDEFEANAVTTPRVATDDELEADAMVVPPAEAASAVAADESTDTFAAGRSYDESADVPPADAVAGHDDYEEYFDSAPLPYHPVDAQGAEASDATDAADGRNDVVRPGQSGAAPRQDNNS